MHCCFSERYFVQERGQNEQFLCICCQIMSDVKYGPQYKLHNDESIIIKSTHFANFIKVPHICNIFL